ncbi:DUF2975 domain-containing protein [Gynurincola endophyticus]|jgi:hypothetical protein|uniref:DUF2975 domain-containing protein n=1 Tax=Gynurincola endophyticus TaxID=2479004 RepID=UPI000F8F13ED|nr:DUF2975 domain-containing protein [Gynurincola endophyticus]
MKISSGWVLKILLVVSWIIFIGVSIEAGGLIVKLIATMAKGAEGAKYFWTEVDLSALYLHDPGHFVAQSIMIIIVAVMKASLFYSIIVMLYNKKINLAQPFNKEMGRFIFKISYITLVIGFFSWQGVRYAKWLIANGVMMPEIHDLKLDGGDVWLFMSVTLFIIGHIFKRGIEIQEENELTV